jgi:hypothetical protein
MKQRYKITSLERILEVAASALKKGEYRTEKNRACLAGRDQSGSCLQGGEVVIYDVGRWISSFFPLLRREAWAERIFVRAPREELASINRNERSSARTLRVDDGDWEDLRPKSRSERAELLAEGRSYGNEDLAGWVVPSLRFGEAREWVWKEGEGSMDRRVSNRTWGCGAFRNLGGIFPALLPLDIRVHRKFFFRIIEKANKCACPRAKRTRQ